jgi:hypothetical protein
MAFRFGSDRSSTNQNLSATLDALGNPIISSDLSFGASPLGEAARTQVALGVPNGTFNLLPNDPSAEIDSANPIPYWSWEASGSVIATMDFDDTTQTWSVVLDPETAGSGDYGILKTRIPIVNDEGLDIRHFVSSSLIQGIKPASPTAWTMDLTAQYIDTAGAAIGTAYTIGTLTQSGTATNLSSYTNASGPIDTTAAELEIAYTITRGATGLSDVVAIIKSVLVATEYGVIKGGGGGELQVQTQVFTASGDFTVPDGVTHVTIVGMGGGQGGSSGAGTVTFATTGAVSRRSAGQGGAFVVLPDVYVGDAGGTVSVGIGAGGSGGSATLITKAFGGTTTSASTAVAGGSGAATTFGSYLSIGGGGTGVVSSLVYGAEVTAGPSAGTANGSAHAISAFTFGFPGYPDLSFITGGAAGAGGFVSGATTQNLGNGGSANGTAGFGGSGGGGGDVSWSGTALTGTNGRLAGSGGAGGGGGGAMARLATNTLSVNVEGGNGGDAEPNSGAGGGAGGAAATTASGTAAYNSSSISLIPGDGGDGGSGFLAVTWLEVI